MSDPYTQAVEYVVENINSHYNDMVNVPFGLSHTVTGMEAFKCLPSLVRDSRGRAWRLEGIERDHPGLSVKYILD